MDVDDLSGHGGLDALHGNSIESTNTDLSLGDDDSSSDDGRVPRRCSVEGANHMADLARMTTMRNLNANLPVHVNNRRRQSSVAAGITQIGEMSNQTADVAPGHSDKVEDFFRQVNKDARLLKRIGSDGVHGCGGLLLRGVTCCLRTVGLGNPGASVEKMAFDNNISTRGATASEDYGVDEELDEEDDEGADAQTLSDQKKKVHDLGELPALDWTHVSRNLLICMIVIGALQLSTLDRRLDSCVTGNRCLRRWLNVTSVAVGSFFLIQFLAKVLASFLKWTRLLHANNKAWIFIKLHKNFSLLVWSALLFGLWSWFTTARWDIHDGGLVTQFLGCFLAYTAVDVVSEVCKVEMAHRYMWRPYLERARASIWSQYVMFMMTDHAMGVPTKDAEGQALALGFTRAKNLGDNVSLYTVGKAIGFVHANALRHPLGPGRPGTDKEGMINSKTGARLFGGLLFDSLTLKFDQDAGRVRCDTGDAKKLSPRSPAVAAYIASPLSSGGGKAKVSRPTMCNGQGSATGPVEYSLPRPYASKKHFIASPMNRKLSSVMEYDEVGDEEEKEEGSKAWEDLDQDEEEEEEGYEKASTSTEGEERWSSVAPVAAPASGEDLARARTASPPHQRAQQQQQQHQQQHQQKQQPRHRRGGGGLSGSGSKDFLGFPCRRGSVSGVGALRGITLGHLRQMTSKAIALQIMELFEMPPDGVVSRKLFIDRMVDVFVQRRSLQLTLGDYEAILKKVGYLLSVVSAVIVFFIFLRIFGYNIGSLVLTWLSLAVAFSFLFGSSASAFFESIIFVFVTKAYDVGDPVYFVDDTGNEDWYVVTRINMLTTVFRRWDGQATQIANNIMAKKVIRNQWRSGPLLHYTMLSVSLQTPTEKLDLMKAGIGAGMRRGRRRRHGPGGLLPDTVDYMVKGLTDGNRLAVFVMCKQRENGSNMSRRFSNGNIFLKLIARECNRNGISYVMPPQPVTLGGGGKGSDQVMRAREAFLGGEESFIAGARR